MMLTLIGIVAILMSLLPGKEFYWSNLSGKIIGGPIAATWVDRFLLFMIGIGVLIEGLREIALKSY